MAWQEDRIGHPRQQASFGSNLKGALDDLAGEPPVCAPRCQPSRTADAADMLPNHESANDDDILLQTFQDVLMLGPSSSRTIHIHPEPEVALISDRDRLPVSQSQMVYNF